MDRALSQSITHLLHRANQVAMDRFTREIGDTDLTPRQLAVLSAIAANEGASQTDIVDATGIDRSTLADIVARMSKRGSLARRRSKTDARAYVVTLTPEGRRLLALATPVLRRVEDELVAGLPVKRRAELMAALGTLAESRGAA